MQLAAALADLARDRGTALFRDPLTFRAALDDYLDEGTASSGTINLLTDAVRLGAVDGMLTMLDSGAQVQAAVESSGQRLARDRGSNDDRGCQWACAVLGFALGRVPAQLVQSLDPGSGSVPAASPAPPAPPVMSPPMMSPPMTSPPAAPVMSPPAAYGQPAWQSAPAYGSWQAQPPRKSRTGLVVGLVIGAVVLLGGIGGLVALVANSGGDDPAPTHSTTTTSAPVATGDTLDGTGYTVAMPTGWTDQTDNYPSDSPNLDKIAVNADSISGSTANVAIATSETFGTTDPESVRSSWEKGLRNADPTANVADIADKDIDGEQAIGASVTRSGSTGTLHQTAYLVVHGGTGYTIVFTYLDGDTGQSGVFDSFLAGWAWS
ncbi:DcrB/PsbP domain-containing protein [Nocardioides ultimimeridianus]